MTTATELMARSQALQHRGWIPGLAAQPWYSLASQEGAAMRGPHTRRMGKGCRSLTTSLLLCVAVMVIARWPLSCSLTTLALDTNTTLNELIVRDLVAYHDFGEIHSLTWPQSVSVQMVAIPTVLLAASLATWLGPRAAFRLAVNSWYALQGLAIGLLGQSLRWDSGARAAAIVAALLAPYLLVASSNGQPENMAFPAFALVTWATVRGGAAGVLTTTAGLILAGFTSPYQAVSAGIIALSIALFHGRRRLRDVTLASAISGIIVVTYYIKSIQPNYPHPSCDREVAAGIFDLWVPFAMEHVGNAQARLATLARPPMQVDSIGNLQWAQPVSTAYVGVVLLVLGLAGLWRARRTPLARGLGVALVVSVILALGSSLRTWSVASSPIPLPWLLLERLPALGAMKVVQRFLSAASFSLVIGVGLLLDGQHRRWVLLACLALAADGLLRTPVHWPLPIGYINLAPLRDSLAPGERLTAWPPATQLEPRFFELLSLELDHPLLVLDIESPPPPTPKPGAHWQPQHDGHRWLKWVQEGQSSQTLVWMKALGHPPLRRDDPPGQRCFAGACVAPLSALRTDGRGK